MASTSGPRRLNLMGVFAMAPLFFPTTGITVNGRASLFAGSAEGVRVEGGQLLADLGPLEVRVVSLAR